MSALQCPSCRIIEPGSVISHALDESFTCTGCQFVWPHVVLRDARVPVMVQGAPWWPPLLEGATKWLPDMPQLQQMLDDDNADVRSSAEQMLIWAAAHWGHRAQPEVDHCDLSWIADWLPVSDDLPDHPILLLGCSAGGEVVHLRDLARPVYAMDLSPWPVLFAASLGQLTQPGLPWRPRAGAFALSPLELLENDTEMLKTTQFVIGDALNPPFAAETFSLVIALNLLDAVAEPALLLGQCEALLQPGGAILLATPYNWRDEITQKQHRLSVLFPDDTDEATGVEALLTGNVLPDHFGNLQMIKSNKALPWSVPLHPRHRAHYQMHVMLLRKLSS